MVKGKKAQSSVHECLLCNTWPFDNQEETFRRQASGQAVSSLNELKHGPKHSLVSRTVKKILPNRQIMFL